jgi:hypothetical protein
MENIEVFRGYGMPLSRCVWLEDNGKLLLDKFTKRNELVGKPSLSSDLMLVEYDLIRLNRIIKRHRRTCKICISNERISPASLRPLPGEAPVLPVEVQ